MTLLELSFTLKKRKFWIVFHLVPNKFLTAQLTTLPESFSMDRFTGFETEREMELAGVAAENANDTWLWAGNSHLAQYLWSLSGDNIF